MFKCDQCGLCCMRLDKHEETAYLHNGDGICIHLDREKKTCKIYEERPMICRVDDYYDMYLKDTMDREEYYRLNHEACGQMKKEWLEKQAEAGKTDGKQ